MPLEAKHKRGLWGPRHTAEKSYLKGTATARGDMTPVARYLVFQEKPETQAFVLFFFVFNSGFLNICSH